MLKRFLGALILIALFLAAAPSAPAQAPILDERVIGLRNKLNNDLLKIANEFDGVMGIAIKEPGGQEIFQTNGDTLFPTASSIKIPILLELYRQAQMGQLKLEERVDLKRSMIAQGSGVLLRFSDGGSALSLRDLAVLMIVLSDNTATNILIDRVGMDNVNNNLRRLGITQTRLQRRMLDAEAQRADRENIATPREMVMLLEALQQGKTLDGPRTRDVLEILKYPKNTALRRGLPSNVELANKPGGIGGVACDSGIVFLAGKPYIISVWTTYDRDADAAERAIGEVSRRAYEYFERMSKSNAYGARLP